MHRSLSVVAACALALALGACAPNEASGRNQFTAFVSAEEEARIGREQHVKVLELHGGEYGNPRLAEYVQSVGERLAAQSELADKLFTFTILNSDISNAFALPGGYIYITRGLLALMGSEAELAAVLGHEIGHVAARHTAERMSSAYAGFITLNLLRAGVSIATGSGVAGGAFASVGGTGLDALLASYSREQEFEADKLGVRYMARAGYDPVEAADMLDKLGADQVLRAKADANRAAATQPSDMMRTHPRTADRVAAATEAARAQGMEMPAEPHLGVDAYLDAIDGMTIEGDDESGVVSGTKFVHPGLRFAFDVPEDFDLVKGSDSVTARGPNDARIRLTWVRQPATPDPQAHLTAIWMGSQRLENVETFDLNGLSAARGQARIAGQSGAIDVRLIVIQQADGIFHRLLMTAPASARGRFDEPFQKSVASFHPLADRGLWGQRALRLRIVTVRSGDTQETFLRQIANIDNYGMERFQLINGLKPGEALEPGRRLKIFTDR